MGPFLDPGPLPGAMRLDTHWPGPRIWFVCLSGMQCHQLNSAACSPIKESSSYGTTVRLGDTDGGKILVGVSKTRMSS